MKSFQAIFLVLLVFAIVSCTESKIKIKTSSTYDKEAENAYLRTTKVDIENEAYAADKEPKEPVIKIISPQEGEITNSSTIVVMLNISNFKIVTPDNYPRKGQGHVQVWVDNMEFRGSNTEFVFENESN